MQPCQISPSLIDIHIYKGIASQHLVIKMFLDEESACKGLIGSGMLSKTGWRRNLEREREEREAGRGGAEQGEDILKEFDPGWVNHPFYMIMQ